MEGASDIWYFPLLSEWCNSNESSENCKQKISWFISIVKWNPRKNYRFTDKMNSRRNIRSFSSGKPPRTDRLQTELPASVALEGGNAEVRRICDRRITAGKPAEEHTAPGCKFLEPLIPSEWRANRKLSCFLPGKSVFDKLPEWLHTNR